MRVLSLVKLIRLAKDLNSGEDNSFLLGAITGRIFMMCDLGLMSDKDSESLANYVDSFIDIDDADDSPLFTIHQNAKCFKQRLQINWILSLGTSDMDNPEALFIDRESSIMRKK